MLSEVMHHFAIAKDFSNAGYFETDHHKKILGELRFSIKEGKLIALVGIVGCGKTTILNQIQKVLKSEKEILVSKSFAVEKEKVKLATLMTALFYDLNTEKETRVPTKIEERERKLTELIKKRQKPVVLFIDEAHDLHGKTLIALKRLIEISRDNGGVLSIVLCGHPKLKNDLRRSTLQEIGARSVVLELEGIKGYKEEYLQWLFSQCLKPKTKRESVLSDETLGVIVNRLATPLQIEHYLTLAFEEAYKTGQKPVTPEVIKSVLARDLDSMESRLVWHGYDTKALSDLLNIRQAEIKSFLNGQLPPSLTEELRNKMMAAGVPI